MAALNSYDEPLVLLLGGRDKKLPWETMLSLALTKTRQIVAFGEFGEGIVELVKLLCGSEDPVTLRQDARRGGRGGGEAGAARRRGAALARRHELRRLQGFRRARRTFS